MLKVSWTNLQKCLRNHKKNLFDIQTDIHTKSAIFDPPPTISEGGFFFGDISSYLEKKKVGEKSFTIVSLLSPYLS